MNELMNMVNMNISGWMCSGNDFTVMSMLLKRLLQKAAEQRFVQAVILSEDMLPVLREIVEGDLRNKGYLPSYDYRYFPAFEGENTDMKERMAEILQKCLRDREKVDEVMIYVDFLTELESKFGDINRAGDEQFFWKYTHASAVESVLTNAVAQGELTTMEYEDWISDYTDCSSGRIHLKRILHRLNRCFALNNEQNKSIASLSGGERLCFVIQSDMSDDIKELMFRLIGWDILEAKRRGKQISLSVIEGSKKYNEELLQLLSVSPSDINFNFYTKDFFAGHSTDWKEKIEEYFQRFVYTSHTQMESCEEISSKRFGQIPVVRNTYTCDRDRRISNNRVLDQIFNTNRVDHYVQHVPVWEPQYRKEEIYGMPKGTCLVQTESFEGYLDLR